MFPVEQPFKVITGRDGKPLDNGFVYFGVPYLNPLTSQTTVYWDAALTQPAAQPLRTENGYIVRTAGGGPANVFQSSAYSVIVQDSKRRQVAYARSSDDFSLGGYLSSFVTNLLSSVGSTLVGFLQAGTGAVLRTIYSKMRERVSVTDFMTDAERADCLTGAPVLDVTAAFNTAIAAAYVVEIPDGTYLVGNIKINKNNFTLRGTGYNRCTLLALNAAQITIEVATTNSVSFLVLEDFKIQGNVTALGGIKLGSSDTFYCAGAMLNRVGSWDFSRATTTNGYGVQLACVQNLSVHNCWIYRNRHQYQRLQGTGYATSVKISGKTGYQGEGYVGIYIDAQIGDLYVDDGVIEGNANSGMIVTANAVLPGSGSNIYINGAYAEANNTSGAGVIYITGGAGAYQQHTVLMERINFAVNTGFYVTLDRVIATIRNCKLIPSQVSTTVNCDVNFEYNRYPNAANYLTAYRALLGNITVRDTNVPATGTDLNQINLVNAITFPTIPRLVTDETTLDDYRERVTGQYVPVATGFGGVINSIVGSYVKIGRKVFFEIVINGTGLSSVWTTSFITLPVTVMSAAAACFINASNGLGGVAFIDASANKVATPNITAANAVLTISGHYVANE